MEDKSANPVLAFDVYGTLIDPFRMEEHLRAAFGEKAREASELWRGKQIEYSFRRALMKKYRNFDKCTAQALRYRQRAIGSFSFRGSTVGVAVEVSAIACLSGCFCRAR